MDTWLPPITLLLGVLSVGLYIRATCITPGAENLKKRRDSNVQKTRAASTQDEPPRDSS